MFRLVLPCTLALCLMGCNKPVDHLPHNGASAHNSGETDELIETNGDWAKHIGTKVTVTGKALNHKIGAYVQAEAYGIYVDLPETHWPNELYFGGDDGETITVTRTVAERNDLPVFIQNPDMPPIQGIPVPAGTDLENASKRFILESVDWNKAGIAR